MDRRSFLAGMGAGTLLLGRLALASPVSRTAASLWASIDVLSGQPVTRRSPEALRLVEEITELPDAARADARVQDALMRLCDWIGEGLLAARETMAQIAAGAEVDEAALAVGIEDADRLVPRRLRAHRGGELLSWRMAPAQRQRTARRVVREIDALVARAERIHARGERVGEERRFELVALSADGEVLSRTTARGPVLRILGWLVGQIFYLFGGLFIFASLFAFAGGAVGLGWLFLLVGLLICAIGALLDLIIGGKRSRSARRAVHLNAAGLLAAP